MNRIKCAFSFLESCIIVRRVFVSQNSIVYLKSMTNIIWQLSRKLIHPINCPKIQGIDIILWCLIIDLNGNRWKLHSFGNLATITITLSPALEKTKKMRTNNKKKKLMAFDNNQREIIQGNVAENDDILMTIFFGYFFFLSRHHLPHSYWLLPRATCTYLLKIRDNKNTLTWDTFLWDWQR